MVMMIDPFGSVIEFLLPPLMIHEHEQMAKRFSFFQFCQLQCKILRSKMKLLVRIQVLFCIEKYLIIKAVFIDKFDHILSKLKEYIKTIL